MRYSYLRLFAVSAFAGVLLLSKAQAAPIYLLPLTCSSEAAIGRPQNECDGTWTYEEPTSERLIVFRGPPFYVWDRAENLASSDLVQVCFLPVEPGTYSSCRSPTTGLRATGYQLKGLLFRGGNVIVSKSGGDYSDPVAAAKNAFAGDTWCVAPQPGQPCVMAIDEGVFVLKETLSLSDGLAVSGAGKGATMLVADNGVETAVAASGAVGISDLTIINSQPGLARTTGLAVAVWISGAAAPIVRLQGVVIRVSGAAKNVAVSRGSSIEVVDSEIAAIGADTTGVLGKGPDTSTVVTLERSRVSAERALDEDQTVPGMAMRLIDSTITGAIWFNAEYSPLEIVGSQIVGNIAAHNDAVRVTVKDSTIKGNLNVYAVFTGHSLSINNVSVEGAISFWGGPATIEGLTLHGTLLLDVAQASVLRSYISSTSTTAALSLGGQQYSSSETLRLEHSFLEGAIALAADATSNLQASSSVLAGPVSAAFGASLSCTGTSGADYELLTASCQPQPPP